MKQLRRELDRFLKPKRVDHDAKDRARFRRLAMSIGATYHRTHDDYIEIAPCARLPHGLITTHHTWSESLDRLHYCLAHPEVIEIEDGRGYYAE